MPLHLKCPTSIRPKIPISMTALFVAAFFILFLVFFLWGCSAGMPADKSHVIAEPDKPLFQTEFPRRRLEKSELLVPFGKAEKPKPSGPAFPNAIPAEQQSGREGLVPQEAADYGDMKSSETSGKNSEFDLYRPPQKASANAADSAERVDGGWEANQEDWSRRCYLFPENSLDRPEFCRSVRDNVLPSFFKESGIPLSGEIRHR